ncbi:proline-rich protein 2-like [Phodopus roborovskii]|uniref:proline-rich protein 2-like n=1 Tax=Phodopus roborovskii TaxID=109678 RepID=UPI0021E39BA8|nr:proline-rich protein 2-like [Phodopus roborovskii]
MVSPGRGHRVTSSLAFPEGWLPGLYPGRREPPGHQVLEVWLLLGATPAPRAPRPAVGFAVLGDPAAEPRAHLRSPASRAAGPKCRVPRGPGPRARRRRRGDSPGFRVSVAQRMPRSAQEPGKCPGARRGAPPLITARARCPPPPAAPSRRPHSGAARASLAPAVRAAQSRAERGGAGPRPGPGFPRTRPRGERPRAPPWAAGRPGERLVPDPPPTLPHWTRPHHPAIPPWQSKRPSPGPLAKAPRSRSLAQTQEGGGYSCAGSPCSRERGNSAHLRGLEVLWHCLPSCRPPMSDRLGN